MAVGSSTQSSSCSLNAPPSINDASSRQGSDKSYDDPRTPVQCAKSECVQAADAYEQRRASPTAISIASFPSAENALRLHVDGYDPDLPSPNSHPHRRHSEPGSKILFSTFSPTEPTGDSRISTPEPKKTSASRLHHRHDSLEGTSSSRTAVGLSAPSVHFHSRVRITSGVHNSNLNSNVNSRSSSVSASSSISAPLRSFSEGHSHPTGFGGRSHSNGNNSRIEGISQVLPSDVANAWLHKGRRTHTRKPGSRRNSSDSSAPTDRSPLISGSSGNGKNYGLTTQMAIPGPRGGTIASDETDALRRLREATTKTEIDIIYGSWPWRLLNPHVRIPRFLLGLF